MIKGVDVHEGKIGIIADVIQNALDIPCAALSQHRQRGGP